MATIHEDEYVSFVRTIRGPNKDTYLGSDGQRYSGQEHWAYNEARQAYVKNLVKNQKNKKTFSQKLFGR